ncbi:L,D-transpeptidase [Nocardioides mesophilus]|uniref:L,D-transpeptidase n=1 Tax=Nocardioides mesophilus TaxID=433659 RepID=A0A7G9R835_9ACTN|nr:L,D-transpeptidase [Nocardioides mesophilus]QNN51760.1 L,D-transpeptidase [Nocardioides mesophilus]
MTLIAVCGGLGVLPGTGAALAADRTATLTSVPRPTGPETAQDVTGPDPAAQAGARGAAEQGPARTSARFSHESAARAARAQAELAVPADSGSGRRVVFDMAAQRVWLVDGDGAVQRTYLVSGSVTDNLQPGEYDVWSRSEQAWGIDDSGTMKFMVRFAHGDHAAIGFHDIPIKDGRLVQTRDELGSPRSHGCIRQWRPDAKALWRFAPVGTSVVVVA